jgi:uncharacterized protein YbjT (DUF2867 family)
MADETRGTTLVIGGTGKSGRRVAQRLRARGLPVRVGSRAGEPPFDWGDRSTWRPALEGARAAYLSYHPDLAVPGAADTVGALARLAARLGVERLVLLSGRGEEEAERTERAVQDAGADWTVVRSGWFSQNFSESFLLDAVLAGEVALPVGGVPEPFVDLEDVADVAAAALADDGHAGRVYELTGPRLIRFDEALAEIARASGRPVRFVPISADEYAARLSRAGLPDDVVWLLTYLFTEVLDGRNARLADGVQRALGRPPRDFGDYARRTASLWAA